MFVDISPLETFIQGALTTVAIGFVASAIRNRMSKDGAHRAGELRAHQRLPLPSGPEEGGLSTVTLIVANAPQNDYPQTVRASSTPTSDTHNAVVKFDPAVNQMHLASQLFTVPRIGDQSEENCDASASNEHHQAFAVADGASQSFNSGDWARLITTRWVSSDAPVDISEVAEHCALEWHEFSDRALASLPPDSLIREKMAEGSSATFGGVRLVRKGGNIFWQIITVGDVLIVATQRKLDGERYVLRTFPFSVGSNFGAGTPHQVSTNPPFVRTTVNTAIERLLPSLEFVLMTDAVARCIFNALTRNTKIVDVLPFLNQDQQAFLNWVNAQRALNLLDDDDSTVLDISMPQTNDAEVA